MSIEPDTKDWTWVLDHACPECGFDAAGLDRDRLPQAIRDNADLWAVVLADDDAAVRPEPHIWSPLEYAGHVADVHRVFGERLRLMLTEDEPTFPNWDQDQAAIEADYGSRARTSVAADLAAAAEEVASAYEQVADDAWQRRGLRSNGSEFTVDTLGRYHLHDLVHHAHDVSHVTKRVTLRSYDEDARAYAASTATPSPEVVRQLDAFAAAVGAGARVLEIGSAQGRDARALDEQGVEVRATDLSPVFVRLLRASGIDADVLDPLHDDLTDPARDAAYDGVWAAASLLHVRREDLPIVLARLASVTRPGGVLGMSVKEGDGARFSTHGSVSGPRHFTYWREDGLRDVLERAGWRVSEIAHRTGTSGQPWLVVTAERG